jgi:hypothetical protein
MHAFMSALVLSRLRELLPLLTSPDHSCQLSYIAEGVDRMSVCSDQTYGLQ